MARADAVHRRGCGPRAWRPFITLLIAMCLVMAAVSLVSMPMKQLYWGVSVRMKPMVISPSKRANEGTPVAGACHGYVLGAPFLPMIKRDSSL